MRLSHSGITQRTESISLFSKRKRSLHDPFHHFELPKEEELEKRQIKKQITVTEKNIDKLQNFRYQLIARLARMEATKIAQKKA